MLHGFKTSVKKLVLSIATGFSAGWLQNSASMQWPESIAAAWFFCTEQTNSLFWKVMTVNCKELNLSPLDGWRTESNTEQWKPLAPRSLWRFKPALRQPNHPFSYTLLQLVTFNWYFSLRCCSKLCRTWASKEWPIKWRICLSLTMEFTTYKMICDIDRHHHRCLTLIFPCVKWHMKK